MVLSENRKSCCEKERLNVKLPRLSAKFLYTLL